MRKICCVLVLMLLFTATVFAGEGVLERLRMIPQISDIKELKIDEFNEYYQSVSYTHLTLPTK